MRNLKKVLALVLALVMSMSLVTIANASDFTDSDKITYTEAVDVMTGIGVLNGLDTGAFNPTGTLTREQAAKIICTMLLGDNADKLGSTSSSFTDVAVTRWSSPYIEYCASSGIIAGVGNGQFNPTGKLTGYAFAKMLLVALGYNATTEGYVGAGWSIEVAKDAVTAGIQPKGIVMSAELTREQAAQMAFQTLEATLVEYKTAGSSVVLPDGTQIITSGASASKVENNDKNAGYDGEKDGYQQFCEEYFSDLKKTDKADKFQRPGYTWELDGDFVGFGSKDAVATYAGADFDEDVVSDLNDDYTGLAAAPIYYNGGTDVNMNLTKLQKGINGYTIEIYANDDDEITAIVVTEPYAAEVVSVNTNDDDEITSIELTIYEAGYYLNNSQKWQNVTVTAKTDKDAFKLVKDYEEGDIFMTFLTPGWDADDADADKTFLAVDDNLETITGTVTAKSATSTYTGWVKIDGEKYEFANEYSQAPVATKDEGVFYLYNGYIVHFDGEATASEDYLYVVRTGTEEDKWGKVDTYFAEVVYADGTSEVINIDKDSYNAATDTDSTGPDTAEDVVFSYSFNKKDEVYELSAAKSASVTAAIEKGKTPITADKKYTADSQTVYVSIKLDDGKFDSAKTYTGYKNVASMTSSANMTFVVAEKGKAADFVFIVDGKTSASTDDLIYIAGDSKSAVIDDSDLGNYYLYNAVVDGEVVEIMVTTNKEGTVNNDLDGLYNTYAVDEDGIYSDLDNTDAKFEDTTGNFGKASNEVITVGADGAMAYTEDVALFVIDDGDITVGSINRNYSGDGQKIFYTVNSDGAVTALYIVK